MQTVLIVGATGNIGASAIHAVPEVLTELRFRKKLE